MGCWGDKLYQNDMAQDLKDEYRTYLKLGYSDLEVEDMMIDSFEEYIDDGYDKEFWLVLADQEYKLGRLSKKVKKKALSYLKNVDKKELVALKARLNSEPLPRKKMRKFYMSRPIWNVGDILLYKITDECLFDKNKDSEYIGKYILFQVTATSRYNIGYLQKDEFYNEYAIVTLYDWIGDNIPTEEEISKLEFKKRKNLEAMTLANYLPDTIENGIVKWKKLDFDTVQYIFSFTKRELTKLNIVSLIPAKEKSENVISSEGRSHVNIRCFNDDLISIFTTDN